MIVFAKCDLVPQNERKEYLINQFKSIFSDKQLLLTSTQFSASELGSISTKTNEKCSYQSVNYSLHENQNHHYNENNYKFNSDYKFDTSKLKEFFHENVSIVRSKGFINTQSGWMLFNYTLSGVNFEPCLEKNLNEIVIISDNTHNKAYSINCCITEYGYK